MTFALTAIGGLALAIWLYLLLGHGEFWRVATPLDDDPPDRDDWPSVAAVIPARNEAETIAQALSSVLSQEYAGPLAVYLVDDSSEDGTADVARQSAVGLGLAERLTVVTAGPPPPGWAGKLWALSEGLNAIAAASSAPTYLWFTDADIAHEASTLRRLVAAAEAEDRDLVSLMVLLTNANAWEKLLIPPFVFFFAMLYPFRWIADPGRKTAGAAGGCLMVRAEALERSGSLAAMRDALIDDCTLADRIKRLGRTGGGRLRLALTWRSHSIRPYPALADIWRMVARSAYTQLRHSPILLIGTLVGMALTYVAPPLLALTLPLHGLPLAAGLGAVAWGIMAALFLPTLRFYGQPWPMAFALPVAALFYAAMTADSARRHATGRGGQWKGRVQAPRGGASSRPH